MENQIENPPRKRRLVPRKAGFAYALVSNTKGYDLINRGKIKAVKLDGKLLIDLDSVDAFHASLPEVAHS